MRYALIIAGGSGTRLWPMSTRGLPKQLIPFIRGTDSGGHAEQGNSLLDLAMQRLEGLLPEEQIYVCASQATREQMLEGLSGLSPERFYGEPEGRDTLNAVGLGAAERLTEDPDAVIAVFTADHLIQPEATFKQIVERGFEVAEARENTLVTFGIEPTHAATGYGYLELGQPIETIPSDGSTPAFVVNQFKEKPDQPTAERYFQAGADHYLWNSGMFVWRGRALMNAIEKFAPENAAGLAEVADAWHTARRDEVLERVYPTLEKISVDFAVMEPASRDDQFTVAALPMPVDWLDVGSWPAFGQTLEKDEHGNAASGGKSLMVDTRNTLVASDQPDHLITTIGCEGLIVIQTKAATLVCKADEAERIKDLHKEVGKRFGEEYL